MPSKSEVKAKERIRKGLTNYVEILGQAAQRGISEEDTSTIVQSMLVDLCGYDRFREITGQYAVRGRWADWAVKVNDNLHFFVEVKPLGSKLREKDLFQLVSYSRQYAIEWTVLTTGDVWQCHHVANGQEPEAFFEVRILDPNQPIEEKIDALYLLTREASSRGELQERWAEAACFRPERLARLLLSEDVMSALRRAVHRETPGRRVDACDLREAVIRGVMRGDLYDAITQTPTPEPSHRPRKNRSEAARKASATQKATGGEETPAETLAQDE